jgi:hypothetical protein
VRLTAEQRQQNESRIRVVMNQLLAGDIPPDGKCDIKTLAREASVDRTAFYGTRPYNHLRKEFETKLATCQQTGDHPDRRDAQIIRLKTEVATLNARLARRDQTITDLTAFKTEAVARLAAQHEEIHRLRRQTDQATRVHRLPVRTQATGPE